MPRYIREEYGDFFGITVAGYPEAHPEVIKEDPEEQKKAYASDLAYLKKKVDAGADVIVTQLFYDVDIFLKCAPLPAALRPSGAHPASSPRGERNAAARR